MKSESLRGLKTARHIKSGLDLLRDRRIKTTNSLHKAPQELEMVLPEGRALEGMLEKERRRFASQMAAVERSREGMLKLQQKLALTINRNKALMEVRRELQRAQWEDDPQDRRSKDRVEGRDASEEEISQVELEY
jgi:hypothetical protein